MPLLCIPDSVLVFAARQPLSLLSVVRPMLPSYALGATANDGYAAAGRDRLKIATRDKIPERLHVGAMLHGGVRPAGTASHGILGSASGSGGGERTPGVAGHSIGILGRRAQAHLSYYCLEWMSTPWIL